MSAEGVFGATYADCYDLLYRTKNYSVECDFVEEVFRQYAAVPVRTILDLGCGTGSHALCLAERGYEMTGVDRSEEMLRVARAKPVAGEPPPVFRQSDIRALELGCTYDAAIMLFAVMSYLTSNDDLAAALAAVRRHLAPGGLFVADFWYGPAVLAQRPTDRVGEWSENGTRVLRLARSRLAMAQQTVEVCYHLLRLHDTRVESETEETHVMRYLFPQEMAYFASQAGFAVVHVCPFPVLNVQPTEEHWDVAAVFRAIG